MAAERSKMLSCGYGPDADRSVSGTSDNLVLVKLEAIDTGSRYNDRLAGELQYRAKAVDIVNVPVVVPRQPTKLGLSGQPSSIHLQSRLEHLHPIHSKG